MGRWWGQVWRRASALLPALLLALLAAFSWWVAREAARAIHGERPAPEAQQKPDYFLEDFRTRSYAAAGGSSSELSGKTMEHIPGNQIVRIGQPRLRVEDAQGVVTTAQARLGLSNADGSNVQLFGAAQMERVAPGVPLLRVSSEFLNIFPQSRKMSSNRPSVVQQGASRFAGDGMELNGLDGTFVMQGKVRGTIVPPS